MLIIYHSNCLELFMKFVINIMSNCHASDPMQSEIILTNHKIIEKWMEIKLANHFGIAANIKFMSLGFFIKNIFSNTIHPSFNIHNYYQDFIFWQFMETLPEVCIKKNCAVLQNYLYNDFKQKKLGQLSEQLSNLFSEYLIYRPDWLDSWSVNKIINNVDTEYQEWQAEIWRTILHYNISHSFQKFHSWTDCIDLIQKNIQKINHNELPKKIFICGIVSMPPVYWKILDLLSSYTDIYFWFIDPCINSREYIVYNKSNINKNHHNILYNHFNHQHNCVIFTHPLLQAWNKTGQDVLCLLGQLENFSTIKNFKVPKPDSMLHILQKDILETPFYRLNHKKNQFNCINTQNKKKYILKSSDCSISIHECHNIQREIEILHDNLLFMLSNDSELLPGEIIVMAPNISNYESAIQNTFNNIFNRQLPFTVSSNSVQHIHPIILTLFKILEVSYSRITSEEVMSLLSISSIASKFNMNIKEIQLLQKWVIESGIRWGLDSKTMYDFDLPTIDQNTWYFGLKRMLLGYAINSQDGLWETIFPYDYTNEECICLVSRLGELLNTLKKWRDRLNISYTLIEWMPYIQDIINDFFDCKSLNSEENKALFLFKTCWIDLIQSGISSGYSKIISIVVLRDILQIKLNRKKINYQFLPNSINFYDITPICCIPCKVLCIIGMNHDIFPRDVLSCNLNLILKKPRIGDNNIWEKDSYSFLLSCLLPTNRLYISFIKKLNHYSNIIDTPSKLVDELLEYIIQNFYFIEDSNLDVNDNIERLRKHLFRQYGCMPFSSDNFVAKTNTKTKSFAHEWLTTASTNIDPNFSIYSNFMTTLPDHPITTISFSELYNFYRHPIRTWFQKRLGVYFPVKTAQVYNNEPFFVDNKDRFLLNMKIIDSILHHNNTDKLYHESYASGILPYGAFGKLFWIKEYERMTKLTNEIKPFYFPEQSHKLNISLKFDAINLIGQLNMVQKNGLIRWRPANLPMRDCFLLWLEHLIYCAVGGHGESQLFGINNTWRFPNLSESVSKNMLYSLISGYCIGITNPLMLLYQSGGVWINDVFNWHDKTISSSNISQKKARYKLIQVWRGNNSRYCFSSGENQDPYLRKIIPLHLNDEIIQNIIDIAKHYFLNVMKYRIL